jgi:hypothetical protein
MGSSETKRLTRKSGKIRRREKESLELPFGFLEGAAAFFVVALRIFGTATTQRTKPTTRDYGRIDGERGKLEAMHVMNLTNVNANIGERHVTTVATPNVAVSTSGPHWQRVPFLS